MHFNLREWQLEDAENLAKYANNPRIARNLRDAFPYPYTPEDALSYISGCVSREGARQLCRAIEIDGAAVGSIGIFVGADISRKSGELGYWLAEPFWNKGIMSAAIGQICRAAFDVLDIVRIYAEPFAYNSGSRRALEKAGFSLEGTMKMGVYKNGALYDYCMYALLKPSILAGNGKETD